ncbi:MAG TPA: hypothetical protein VI035_06605 [Solirubrobacterales bacterium]
MINSSRSERGWRGRRRIAVLVSIAGVLCIAALSSATSASAATVANCNAKLDAKGGGTKAKLSFTCDGPVRAYTVGSNKAIKNYGNPSAGSATQFFSCQGSGVGFGCGVQNRATPGSQAPGTTGWGATFPPAPGATDTPTTCGGFKRIEQKSDGFPADRNGIVNPPCDQVIPAGTKVTQSIKLASSACAGGSKNPLQMYLLVGGEPPVTSFTVGGDSTTVGEYLESPATVSLKSLKSQCSSGKGKSAKRGGGKKSSAPATTYPVSCSGLVAPSTSAIADATDASLTFTCNQNVRAFAIYSNKTIDIPGDEPVVNGTSGGGVNEGALHQCQGDIPGAGYGCGIVDRQAQSTTLTNGQGISANNFAEQQISFESRPCTRKGEPKPKVWLVAMGEPITSATTVGEFTSAPQQIAIGGFGKCKGGQKKK